MKPEFSLKNLSKLVSSPVQGFFILDQLVSILSRAYLMSPTIQVDARNYFSKEWAVFVDMCPLMF